MMKFCLAVIIALLLFSVPPPPAAAEAALKKATLMPLWSPQAQFAGYYVALKKGIYARHGIDLTILKAGPGHSPVQALQNGSADFAVLWLTTALQHRSTGVSLVNLAQIVQRSSLMLISRKSSGIKTIADMNGKKVGMWGGDLSIPLRALIAQQGIKVHEVAQSQTVNLFLRGGIDVTAAMWYNEYHTLLNSGLDRDEMEVIFLHEQGMNFPEDGLYAMEETVRNDPGLAAAFVTASLAGWRYAFEHPDEALDIVIGQMREERVPANRIHQKWMLDRMRDLFAPGSPQGRPGLLYRQDYEAVGCIMCIEGLIPSAPDYTVFTGGSDAGE